MIWKRILKATRRKGIENILTSVYTKDNLETVYYDLYEFYIFNKPSDDIISRARIMIEREKRKKKLLHFFNRFCILVCGKFRI
jgi:hypothetical protein